MPEISLPKALLFDFDLTMVDTTELRPYRDSKRWRSMPFSKAKVYEGIPELLNFARKNHIHLAVVSTAPKQVYLCPIIRLLELGIPDELVIGYHDVTRRKPHPDAYLLAAKKLLVDPQSCWCVGDRSEDMIAAKLAGMISVAALWGSENSSELIKCEPDIICSTPEELKTLLMMLISQNKQGDQD